MLTGQPASIICIFAQFPIGKNPAFKVRIKTLEEYLKTQADILRTRGMGWLSLGEQQLGKHFLKKQVEMAKWSEKPIQ